MMMMNNIKTLAFSSSKISNFLPLTAALFHSTPPLSLKKRTYWGPGRSDRRGPPRRYRNYYKGFTNPLVKQLVVRSINSRSDYIVLQCDNYDHNAYMDEIRSWCGQDFLAKGSQVSGSCNLNNYGTSRGEKTENSSSNSKQSGNSSSSNDSISNMISERRALGLSASGNINLDDVKNAYLACAVKWHPDHHQGFSKTFAEEQFKICSAAYESLRNKLSSN